MKLPIQVYCNPKHWWFLSKNIQAITLPPFIFYNGLPDNQTRCHEFVHWYQANKKYTWIGFYVVYLWFAIRYGYSNHPMEREAYQHQDDCR